MKVSTARVVGLVCLVVLVAGLTVQSQEASNRLREGEHPVLPGAEPATPGGDGGTTLGAASDLSVFSVMKFAGSLRDTRVCA
jgi:hypothetical protein